MTIKSGWLIGLMLAALTAYGQQSNLRGEVSLQNSQTWTGKRQYVEGAQVKDLRERAEERRTDNGGHFELTFRGIKEKQSVVIDVIKTGLQVVNTSALSAVAGQEDMVKISMADPASISEYRSRIYNVGRTQAEMRLQQRLDNAGKELQELKKNLAKNAGRIAEMEKALAKMQDERNGIDDLALDLATKYAPVNLDDASPLFKDAFNVFQQGNFDSALYILERIDLEKKVNEALRSGEILDSLKKDLAAKDTLQRRVVKEIAEVLHLKADLHKTNYDIDSALKCYQLLIRLDTANADYLIDYGNFLDWLNRHAESMIVYKKALVVCNDIYGKDSLLYNPAIARAKHNLGLLYLSEDNLSLAEINLMEALTIRKHLAAVDPRTYESFTANTESSLGTLYMKRQDFSKAKSYFDSALSIRQKLAVQNAVVYEPDYAEMLNKLGVLYSSTNTADDSGHVYLQQALAIYNRLSLANSKLYLPDAARINNNLGVWYYNRKEYAKADSFFIKALEIRQKLVLQNPQSYQPDLAVTFNNMGSLYSDTKEYVKADTAFTQALTIRKSLAKQTPEVYDEDVAQTLNNTGILYSRKKDFANAIKFYHEAATIRTQLAVKNPQLYLPAVASIQTNLGMLFYNIAKPDSALAAFTEAYTLYDSLFSASPQKYEPDLANALCNLAVVYVYKGDKMKAKNAYSDALKMYTHLAAADPKKYAKQKEAIQQKLNKIDQ